MAINVFQIFYDEDTRKILDPAFLPLDNSNAARPDWLEYWPIRTVLLNNNFADTDYVGFLSPRFFEKTGFFLKIPSFEQNKPRNKIYQNAFINKI